MLVHVPSGPNSLSAAVIAECKQLFAAYPLAVTCDSADGSRSMVLMDWAAAGGSCFFILTQVRRRSFRHPAMEPPRDRPGDRAGRGRRGRYRPGDRDWHANPARRCPAWLGTRPPGDRYPLGAQQPSAGIRFSGPRPGNPGDADGWHLRTGLAAVHGQSPCRRAALGLSRARPDRGCRPSLDRIRWPGVLGAQPERAQPHGAACGASSSQGTCRQRSTGFPPASTWIIGYCPKASPLRSPGNCSLCPAL